MTKHAYLFCFLFCLSVAAHAGVNGQLRQGGDYYNQQKYGSAIQTYQDILKHHPDNQRAWFNIGDAYYRLNEYTQAEEAYQRAAELKGDFTQDALFNLGNTYYRTGDKEKAIENYKAVILANPQDKEAIHNLQLLLEQQQNQQNDNDQNNENQNDNSDNQDQNQDNNQGQSPDQQNQQQPGQLSQSDADRVMSMAKEKEYKHAAGSDAPERVVEKDW